MSGEALYRLRSRGREALEAAQRRRAAEQEASPPKPKLVRRRKPPETAGPAHIGDFTMGTAEHVRRLAKKHRPR